MQNTLERTKTLTRTVSSKKEAILEGSKVPKDVIRELNNRSLYHFLKYFWHIVSPHDFQSNWHIEYLCDELVKVATRVGNKLPREHDLIINVPPGSTKTIICSIMFPAWCWTKWPWMRFITASYSQQLSLESADYCRDLLKSSNFKDIYPDIVIKDDKDTKSNYKIVQNNPTTHAGRIPTQAVIGGQRYTTSVGGTLMGFHGDILIVDDPINPTQAASPVELANANQWMEQTLPSRKTNKANTPTVLIMQRLHQDDPSGHWLSKQKANLSHISIPGECRNYKKQVQPPDLIKNYVDDLMDVNRLPWKTLVDLEADLGQYGFAGQIGQNPTPAGGGMFKVDHFGMLESAPQLNHIVHTVRYWDKAGTEGGGGAYTVGVKMCQLTNGNWVILDVKRGRWGTRERENIIRETAEGDGRGVIVWVEQEPGSGGKESAEGTIRTLAGYSVYAERPTGNKEFRADPYSVQVNGGNVQLLLGEWNREFREEHRFFPYSTHMDQVDAASGAFGKVIGKKAARCLGR